MTKLYDFSYNNERIVLECDSRKEVQDWADEWWADKNEAYFQAAGDVAEDKGTIIEYEYNDDGESVNEMHTDYDLYFEVIRSDRDEHGYVGV